MEQVVITRDRGKVTVNNKALDPTARVYVTGPHFGEDIFSSTEKIAEAGTFERREAEAMLALGKWSHLGPRIEEVPTGE